MRIKQEKPCVTTGYEQQKEVFLKCLILWKAVRAALNRKSSIERFAFNELYQTLAEFYAFWNMNKAINC